jgi:hypothetical protein
MPRKYLFRVLLEPSQLTVLRGIEARIGAPVSVQIRRAIDAYIDTQTVLTKGDIRKLLRAPKDDTK